MYVRAIWNNLSIWDKRLVITLVISALVLVGLYFQHQLDALISRLI